MHNCMVAYSTKVSTPEIWRIGVCGCGSSLSLYDGIQLPNAKYQLVAVADVHTKKNQRAKEKWGITKTYTDPMEMFEKEDLHLVIIATPPSSHMALTLEAAKRRLHVLVQKPLARTVEEGQSMINCCRENGLGIRVSFVRRYYPAFMKAHSLIEGLGQGLLFRATWCSSSGRKKRKTKLWKEDIDTLGGVLVDLGSHVIDTARWWMGEIIGGNLHFSVMRGALDNIASFILSHKRSATICSLSNVDYGNTEVYEYVATSGGFILKRTREGYPGDWILQIWRDGQTNSPKAEEFYQPDFYENPEMNPFLIELLDYIENIESGKLIIYPGDQGYDTLRITTALYQSSLHTEEMRLNDISLKDIFNGSMSSEGDLL